MHQPTTGLTASIAKRIIELASHGSFQETLLLYKKLHSSGIHGSPLFLPSLLKACASSEHLGFALQLHSTILKTGHITDPVTMNSLLSAYSKHSMVDSARLLFDTAPLRDAVSWNSMVNCYLGNGYLSESLEMFRGMQFVGCVPKPELIAAVLSVCGRMGKSRLGRAIHARVVQNGGFETCVLLPTALVDMYSRCHAFDAALWVFDLMPERNVVSWTAMIAGCITNGKFDWSLEMLREMAVEEIRPNRATIVTVLSACGALGALKHGKEIHGYVIRHGLESEPQIVGAVIHMYGRCKRAFKFASLVFDRAEERDVVTWSLMMASLSQNGDCFGTMKFFQQMRKDGIRPNSVTMLAVICACIGLSSIDHGQGVHGYIVKSGLLSELFVGNSLIDMYAKCGCLASSVQTFVEMPVKDSVSYSCMITSYSLHGHGSDALKLFNEMLALGIKPDGITFLAVLSACNHSGLVDDGKKLFENVSRDGNIFLDLEHYACYIDLLGRSGRLEDACEVIWNMPMKPNPRIWSSLGMACRAYGKSEAAKQLAHWIIDSEPENAANYTLLSTIYAEAGDWCGVEEARRAMRDRGLKKNCGSSRIQDLRFLQQYQTTLCQYSNG